ncbi:MAG: hypothetical protein J6W61_02915, partial [Bacteroidales bacterium]|nr:hypothetical protein [Bacteroidales bacterium]
MRRLHVIIIFFLLIGVSNVSAQKKKLSKAYSTYAAGEYSEAVDYFKDAYSKAKRSDPSRGEYIYMIAECY